MLPRQSNCCVKSRHQARNGRSAHSSLGHMHAAFTCSLQANDSYNRSETAVVTSPRRILNSITSTGPVRLYGEELVYSWYQISTQGACEFRRESISRSHRPRCTNSTCTTQIVQLAASIAKQLREVKFNVKWLYWLRCSLTTRAFPIQRLCTMQQPSVPLQECASASCFVNQHCYS